MPLPVHSALSRNLIIACLEDHPKAVTLLRLAQKRAKDRGYQWRAVFVETPDHLKKIEDGPHQRMLQLLTLAEQMGAQTQHLEAPSMSRGLKLLLEKEGDRIALVVIAGTEGNKRQERHRTLEQLRHYTEIEIVSLPAHSYRKPFSERLRLRHFNASALVYALGTVAAAFSFALLLKSILPPALFRVNDQNVGLLFMIACAFAAGRYGLLPGLVASAASFLAVNYYFTVPYYTIKIASITDILNMILFLSAAVLISLFSSQTRDFAQKAAKRELATQALFTLYRVASEAFSRPQALEKLQQKLERMLESDVAFFMPTLLRPDRVDNVFPKNIILTENDRMALNACWSDMKTTGAASPYNPGTAWRFEPMVSPMGEIGVMGVRPYEKNQLDVWFGRLLSAIADQTATVLEHIDLERSMEETRLREDREQLRSMLLSSVTHDFKTPLAGVIGALSVYRSLGAKLTPEKRAELIDAAMEEALRLDSFITNILDMTRLETGNIRFRKEWHDIKTLFEGVHKRLTYRLRHHELVIHSYPKDVEVCMDALMTQQVVQNLIDNACKYTPAGTKIEVACKTEDTGFVCEVRDHGSGLPPEKLAQVFDKYARLQKKDSQVAGTGLGLAISKAVMEAQGGWITASNHPEGGAVFTFSLPQWRRISEQQLPPPETEAEPLQAQGGNI